MCNDSEAAVKNVVGIPSDNQDNKLITSNPCSYDSQPTQTLERTQGMGFVDLEPIVTTDSSFRPLAVSSVESDVQQGVPNTPTHQAQLTRSSAKPCGIVRPIVHHAGQTIPEEIVHRPNVPTLETNTLLVGVASESNHVISRSPEVETGEEESLEANLLHTADNTTSQVGALDDSRDVLQLCNLEKPILNYSDGETSAAGVVQDVGTVPDERQSTDGQSMEKVWYQEKTSMEHLGKCLEILNIGIIHANSNVVMTLATNAAVTSTILSVTDHTRNLSTTPRTDHPRSTRADVEVSRSAVGLPDGYSRVANHAPRSTLADEEVLKTVALRLEDCAFYAGQLTSREAKRRLKPSAVGSFLLRDSSDPRFLYSLTVKTRRGITSVRIAYDAGVFRLDCDPDQTEKMPAFACVLALVSHYVQESNPHRQTTATTKKICDTVFLDRHGNPDLPVVLGQPYHVEVSSLKHLCRLCTNSALDGRSVERLWLVPTLKEFIKDYPYTM